MVGWGEYADGNDRSTEFMRTPEGKEMGKEVNGGDISGDEEGGPQYCERDFCIKQM
jgi:hypothetical protein